MQPSNTTITEGQLISCSYSHRVRTNRTLGSTRGFDRECHPPTGPICGTEKSHFGQPSQQTDDYAHLPLRVLAIMFAHEGQIPPTLLGVKPTGTLCLCPPFPQGCSLTCSSCLSILKNNVEVRSSLVEQDSTPGGGPISRLVHHIGGMCPSLHDDIQRFLSRAPPQQHPYGRKHRSVSHNL